MFVAARFVYGYGPIESVCCSNWTRTCEGPPVRKREALQILAGSGQIPASAVRTRETIRRGKRAFRCSRRSACIWARTRRCSALRHSHSGSGSPGRIIVRLVERTTSSSRRFTLVLLFRRPAESSRTRYRLLLYARTPGALAWCGAAEAATLCTDEPGGPQGRIRSEVPQQ